MKYINSLLFMFHAVPDKSLKLHFFHYIIIFFTSQREADGLTQRQLSASLGIDVALYNRFEKGERLMKRELVCKLAEIYECNPNDLIKYWLADRVYSILNDEDTAGQVIAMVAEEMPEYSKSSSITV
mgnify:CR=1 FL=1